MSSAAQSCQCDRAPVEPMFCSCAGICACHAGSERGSRDPFGGKCHGIWNVEGDSDPIVVFTSKSRADAYLAKMRALPEEDDDHLDKYHHVFACDVVGAWWNSFDPDPRVDSPLTIAEVVAVQEGDL